MVQNETLVLRIYVDEQEPYTVPLVGNSFTVGTSPDAQIQLVERFVSRQHFHLDIIGKKVFLTDLGSQNGTALNGFLLPPNQPQQWQPGAILTIADNIRIELIETFEKQHTSDVAGALTLAVQPEILKQNQNALLTLNYSGGLTEQHIYFKAQSNVPGLDVTLEPTEHFVAPGTAVTVNARVRALRPFWRGGKYPITFMSMTAGGMFVKTEAAVYLRPRFELLLLLLLLLLVPTAIVTAFTLRREIPPESVALITTDTSAPTDTLEATITSSATNSRTPISTKTDEPTETGTNTATNTSTGTVTVTFTATSSRTATITTTPTTALTATGTLVVCVNQCAASGWQNYVIQPGDTLFSLAQGADVSLAQVQTVNCIADPNDIDVGQSICLPSIPVVQPASQLSISSFCDLSTNTVTFTVRNTGGVMTSPDVGRIWDGARTDLITPTSFQLAVNGTVNFSYSYRSNPNYFGNILFFTASGAQLVSTDCMPNQQPIVTTQAPPVVTTAAPPPAANLVIRAQCVAIDTCDDGCFDPFTRFTVTNTGAGAMPALTSQTITNSVGEVLQSSTFQLAPGQSQTFDAPYSEPLANTFSIPSYGQSSSLNCFVTEEPNQAPNAAITNPDSDCPFFDSRCAATLDIEFGPFLRITLVGAGFDVEDGFLTGDSLEWRIPDPDGVAPPITGTGESLPVILQLTDTTPTVLDGCDFFDTTYSVFLTARDSFGVSDTVVRTIVVWYQGDCT